MCSIWLLQAPLHLWQVSCWYMCLRSKKQKLSNSIKSKRVADDSSDETRSQTMSPAIIIVLLLLSTSKKVTFLHHFSCNWSTFWDIFCLSAVVKSSLGVQTEEGEDFPPQLKVDVAEKADHHTEEVRNHDKIAQPDEFEVKTSALFFYLHVSTFYYSIWLTHQHMSWYFG